MEEDEIEMTIEELQKYIKGEVKTMLNNTDTLEKCRLLQSMLEKRERQFANFLKLCESVAACEAMVKKQYSLLGLEYKDKDSDDEDADKTGFGNRPPSPCELVHDEAKVFNCPTTNGHTFLSLKLEDSDKLRRDNGQKICINLKRQPVVVLTRIPQSKIRSLCQPTSWNQDSEDESVSPPTPQNQSSEDESISSCDSDMQWEPDNDSSDSDYSVSRYNAGSNKRRKMDQKTEKSAENYAALKPSRNTVAKSKVAETLTPQANTETSTLNNKVQTLTPQANTETDAMSNKAKTSTPQANTETNTKDNGSEISRPPAKTNVSTLSTTVPTPSQSSIKATSTRDPPSVSQEVVVNMNVLARKKPMDWKLGKILDIATREDGKLRYKVGFEKGKRVVSGHHIAFECVPKPELLCVGARVVVKWKTEKPLYCPGFVAETPCRKNRMRFLAFLDNHTPVYVNLPSLHLVCQPLANPLDDIVDGIYRDFLEEYTKVWPHPHQIHYNIGQMINVELNGAQQRGEVRTVDCSLIEVFFKNDRQMKWIYRGDVRLEHMSALKKKLESKRAGKKDELEAKID